MDPKVPVGSAGAQLHALCRSTLLKMAQNEPKMPQNEPNMSQNDQNATGKLQKDMGNGVRLVQILLFVPNFSKPSRHPRPYENAKFAVLSFLDIFL